MGTVVSFDLRGEDESRIRTALDDACAYLHWADEVFSTWKPDSPMNRLRRGEITLGHAPAEIADVLQRCRQARELSRGWFDPWRMPGGVDPTGLVKGWATERATERLGAGRLEPLDKAGQAVEAESLEAGRLERLDLANRAVKAAMVNAGGDVCVFGWPSPDRPWRLAIRDPRSTDRFAAVVRLGEEFSALATSGTYERDEHVMDPFTGAPTRALLSASVTGTDLGLADALATALLAAGDDGLEFIDALSGYEALIIRPDYSTTATAGFPVD